MAADVVDLVGDVIEVGENSAVSVTDGVGVGTVPVNNGDVGVCGPAVVSLPVGATEAGNVDVKTSLILKVEARTGELEGVCV
jgi:hypothetical protein